jgi:hypothetical protein
MPPVNLAREYVGCRPTFPAVDFERHTCWPASEDLELNRVRLLIRIYPLNSRCRLVAEELQSTSENPGEGGEGAQICGMTSNDRCIDWVGLGKREI